MAGVFDQDILAAQQLIALYGQPCLWFKPDAADESVPGYPSPGEPSEGTPCHIAFFSPRDLGRGMGEFLGMMAGTEVPTNREIGLLAGGVTFTPEDADTIVRGESSDGARIAIERIDRLAPNGTPVLYYVTVSA